ncbi:MAG: discoidin domain-containing protein [Bacteroidaceae bacterium]|nr:discoidin domain-containing protein [Bacteroidaceae bacterium]
MKRNMMRMLVLAGTMTLTTTVLAQETIKTTLVSGPGRDREEGPAMICDGDISTKWCVDEPEKMPYIIILDAGKPMDFAEYGFVTGNDTQDYPDRNPVTWRVSGSNDKQNWTTIDNQTNDRTLRDENEQEYRFKPDKKGQFRYYRFEFLKMAGGTRIQLSEINLHKVARTAIKTTFVSGTGESGKEGAAMANDGLFYTKWCIDEPGKMPYSIVLDAGTQTAIAEYGLVTGDDTHTYPGRNPQQWKVFGSNDKKDWKQLTEVRYDRSMRDENEQEYRFKVKNAMPFRFYKFEFEKVWQDTRLQLAEIKLYK